MDSTSVYSKIESYCKKNDLYSNYRYHKDTRSFNINVYSYQYYPSKDSKCVIASLGVHCDVPFDDEDNPTIGLDTDWYDNLHNEDEFKTWIRNFMYDTDAYYKNHYSKEEVENIGEP